MTLGDFLTASSNTEVLVALTKSGETTTFATVSAGSAESLSDTIKAKIVSAYTIESLTKIKVTVSDPT